MKIYTKTGDAGDTSLVGAERVSKSSLRMNAIGDVDELNSVIGLLRANEIDEDLDQMLSSIQNSLFDLGALLACKPGKRDDHSIRPPDQGRIELMEDAIDLLQQNVPEIRQFILPDGTTAAATAHLARTVCRRAERSVVALNQSEPCDDDRPTITYLNRLGDLLFVIARFLNQESGRGETFWQQNAF